MNAKEIAEKYVRGNHDALTDNQEIIDLKKDIEEYARKCVIASLLKASENAEGYSDHGYNGVDSETITDENNIVIL